MKSLIYAALALALLAPAGRASEYTTGVIWNPETIANWSSGTPGIFYNSTVFAAGKTIELRYLPITGYVKQLELQVYGDSPATLTFPRLNYSVTFDPVPQPVDVTDDMPAVTLDFPAWVPFIAATDTPTITSTGPLTFVGLNAPVNNVGLFNGRPAAFQSRLIQQSYIGLSYTAELEVADANGDGRVDFFDFGSLKDDFGTTNPRSDFDSSGRVDISDFGLLKANFGHDMSQQGAAAVPEPSSLVLAACAVLCVAAGWLMRGMGRATEEDGPWL